MTRRTPTVVRPQLGLRLLCATCLAGGVLAGLAGAPAEAAPAAAPAHGGGGLDASRQQRATSMMPADSVDGVRARAARAELTPAASAAVLQPYSAADVNGIDVASYQHPGGAAINWVAVRASGVGFAFVKATEDTGYTNPFYTSDVRAARAAGISVGSYHFARPADPAVAQADYFAHEIRTANANLPPVLDLEDTGGLGTAALQSWTATFLARVRSDIGVTPILYTGPYFWKDNLADSTAFAGYPLWLAQYTPATAPLATGGWRSWTFWQWSDGSFPSPKAVPGIAAAPDSDRFAGSAAQLAGLAAGASGEWLTTIAPHLQGGALSTVQLNTYVHDLARGTGRPAVAYAVQRTTRGVQTDVRNAFQRVLGRAADPSGLAAWTQRRGTGGYSEFGMVLAMTESGEFLATSHYSVADFVKRLYQVDLDRSPSAADIASWSRTFAAHGRYAVAYDIGFSPEAIDAAVEREYGAVLGHPANAAGLRGWGASALLSGTRWESMIGALYGTAEYLSRNNLP